MLHQTPSLEIRDNRMASSLIKTFLKWLIFGSAIKTIFDSAYNFTGQIFRWPSI